MGLGNLNSFDNGHGIDIKELASIQNAVEGFAQRVLADKEMGLVQGATGRIFGRSLVS